MIRDDCRDTTCLLLPLGNEGEGSCPVGSWIRSSTGFIHESAQSVTGYFLPFLLFLAVREITLSVSFFSPPFFLPVFTLLFLERFERTDLLEKLVLSLFRCGLSFFQPSVPWRFDASPRSCFIPRQCRFLIFPPRLY